MVAVRILENNKNWVLWSTIDLTPLDEMIESLRVDNSRRAFVINREGKLQAVGSLDSPVPEKLLSYIASDIISNQSTERGSALGGIKVFEGDEGDLKDFIYLAVFVNNSDWILVWRQLKSKIFEPLYNIYFTMALIIASAFFLISFLAYRLSNRIEGYINNEMYKEIETSVKQIKIHGARCRNIIRKLLVFIRGTDVTCKMLYLNTLVKGIVDLCEHKARFASVKLETRFTPNLPLVAISPAEIQQVVLNLVNNAIDTMEQRGGGSLVLTTRATEDQVVLEISDTGPGIPESMLPKIFNPFFTTELEDKRIGVPLSISLEVVKKARGKIEVESTVGLGTTFRVFLPFADDKDVEGSKRLFQEDTRENKNGNE